MRRLLPLLVLLVGCEEPAGSSLGTSSATGQLHGRVDWSGMTPIVEPLPSIENPLDYAPGPSNVMRRWPNPNAPRIKEGHLAGAFVWLEGVSSQDEGPPPPGVELKNRTFSSSRILARVGQSLTLTSRDPFYHSIQARGADYFGLTLPHADRPRSRQLDKAGIVELRSGAGMFWMRSYVLVQPHPYMTITDDAGRFDLRRVPEGNYRLVTWHPHWKIVARERNADSLRVVQVTFAEGWRTDCPVHVRTDHSLEVNLTLGGRP